MKLSHLHALKPVCPRCRQTMNADFELSVHRAEGSGDDITQGSLTCSNSACRQEYPIIDGIPVLVPDVRSWIQNNQWDLLARRDLSEDTESLIGDSLDPGSAFNIARQHISIYSADHYGTGVPSSDIGTIYSILKAGLQSLPTSQGGPVLDLGCAVGGTTLYLSRRFPRSTILGMDLSWGMTRIGRQALTDGHVVYPLRDIGLVYRRQCRDLESQGAERVDFWIGDALWPPFANETFGLVTALNLIDCVTSPIQALSAMDALLKSGGHCLMATPYDWSVTATPIEGWIGGHSQRGEDQGRPEIRLAALLANGASPLPGLRLKALSRDEHAWRVRLHSRCTMEYATDLYVLKAV